MSDLKVSLRLTGDIPHEDLTLIFLKLPFKLIRRGSKSIIGEVLDKDVLSVNLAHWDDENDIHIDNQTQLIIERLAHIKPWLASLDKSRIKTEFYIGTIRTIDQGGFDLPAELVAAIATAGLSIAVSILVVLDDDPE